MSRGTDPHLIMPDYASKPTTLLKNPVVSAISLVNKGANGKRFFLFKNEEGMPVDYDAAFVLEADGTVSESYDHIDQYHQLIKEDRNENGDWNVVYCEVAVPGEVDNQRDVWDEDTIRDTAHSYMKESRLINFMHKSFDAVGNLVESAIAPADIKLDDGIIK